MPQSVLCDASSGVAPEALVAGNQALSSIAPGAAMAGGAAEFQAAARLLKISGANESGGGAKRGANTHRPGRGRAPREVSQAGRCRAGDLLHVTPGPRAVLIGFIAEISVEARHLVVGDPPAVGVLADDHTEVHGEGGAVAEAEVDSEVDRKST